MRSLWVRRALVALLGGIAGFAYYYYIGCRSGACPLTGNPWISTLYGGVMGLLLLPVLRPEPKKEPRP
jgi:hypothetical protein